MRQFDYILVGGGLHGALLALALRARQPDSRIGLVERGESLGGNHTWCFHGGDVPEGAREWFDPLVVHRWTGYTVRFPGLVRRIERPYSAITSDTLHETVVDAFADARGCEILLQAPVASIREDSVTLDDGRELSATAVIDARGPRIDPRRRESEGYQKFVGLELECARPHGVALPILMDAIVEQDEGYRFVYTLPLSPSRLLVEDTYFNNSPTLDRRALRDRIEAYARERGLPESTLVRSEEGVLPMSWSSSYPLPTRGPLRAGYDGGFHHPATGYSLPVAVRLAELVSRLPVDSLFGAPLLEFARDHQRQSGFCQLLNRMLFGWFPPAERWHVFARFYGFPVESIERFYALRLTAGDRARLVLGRPPRGLSLRYRMNAGARP